VQWASVRSPATGMRGLNKTTLIHDKAILLRDE
jgi:hypothetical protein